MGLPGIAGGNTTWIGHITGHTHQSHMQMSSTIQCSILLVQCNLYLIVFFVRGVHFLTYSPENMVIRSLTGIHYNGAGRSQLTITFDSTVFVTTMI